MRALLKESTLHRAAGQSERGLEVFPRDLRPAAGKLKLTKRRGVEGIGGENRGLEWNRFPQATAQGHLAGLDAARDGFRCRPVLVRAKKIVRDRPSHSFMGKRTRQPEGFDE